MKQRTQTPQRSAGARRRSRMLGACVALALVAAACGGDDDDDGAAVTVTAAPDDVTATTAPDEAATTTAPDEAVATTAPDEAVATTAPAEAAATTTEVAAPTPAQGGKLVVGTVFDTFGLEPTTFVGGVTDAHISMALYDPLMRLTPDGVPEPFLAQTVETDDQQTYTITLTEGVMFHDGTPLDAEAVKINIERHMDPELRSRALASGINIDTVTVIDDMTIEIALKFPWAAFPQLLAGNLGLIASPASIAAGTANETPVGSGPFIFGDRIPGDHTTVLRNENYWNEGEPYVDEITYRVIPDDAVRLASVENGEIQAAQSISAKDLAEAANTDGVSATVTPNRVNTIHLNNAVAPMDDVRVRQALAHALDYEALNAVIYNGAANPVHSFLAAGSTYFNDAAEYPEYDPDKAASLIAEYEAENGPVTFVFRCYTEPTRVQLTELATQMWTAVGIDVTAEITDQTTLVIDLFQSNYTAACFSMGAETDDPDVMWYASFHSTSASNYAKYNNPDMDAALAAGRTSADEAVRQEAYNTVQEILATDTPLIQYMSSPWGWVVSNDVGGFVSLPGGEFVPSQVFFVG